MDFKLANSYAEQIVQGDGDQKLLKKLTSMSIGYLIHVRNKFGFYKIPSYNIEHHMASEAVGMAIMAMERRNLPFTMCLKNSFRDLCRQRLKSIREDRVGNILEKCDIGALPMVIDSKPKAAAPDIKAENNEIIERSNDLLDDHDPFSKKVVLQKTRGSTYPEMADIFSTKQDACKRVYWHDIDLLRVKFKAKKNDG